MQRAGAAAGARRIVVVSIVGIDRFGASAPGEVVLRELGITPEHAVERAAALVRANTRGG